MKPIYDTIKRFSLVMGPRGVVFVFKGVLSLCLMSVLATIFLSPQDPTSNIIFQKNGITSQAPITSTIEHEDKTAQQVKSARQRRENFTMDTASPLNPNLDKRTKPVDCTKVRGLHGTWVVNMNISRKYHQYLPIKLGRKQKKALDHGQILPQTTYSWDDDSSCRMHLVTREGLCSVLEKLGVRNMFFVGDSLTESMVVSAQKILSPPVLFGFLPHDNNLLHIV